MTRRPSPYAMETIAVYWEAQVRVYGLSEKRARTLFRLEFPEDRLGHWSEELSELESFGDFELVFLQKSGGRCQLLLVPGESEPAELQIRLDQRLAEEADTVQHRLTPVAILYLYGPHFQDRYGIADAALGPLKRAKIPVHAMGCAGTSVYLVVDDAAADSVRAALAETFVL